MRYKLPMRWQRPSKAELAVIAIIVAVLIALLPPTPHWREAVSESCDRCGNRRVTIENYRRWQLDSVREEWATDYPIPEGHTHDWWPYGHSYSSWSMKWASTNGMRYRDGSQHWIPSDRQVTDGDE